jgi:hypothetical protein
MLACAGLITLTLSLFGVGPADMVSMELVSEIVFCLGVALVIKPRPSAFEDYSSSNDPSNVLEFEQCKVCGASPDVRKNLTHMAALGMLDEPGRFHHEYGMMCSTHARELTRQLLESGKITDGDLETATKQASALIAPGHEQEDERTLH